MLTNLPKFKYKRYYYYSSEERCSQCGEIGFKEDDGFLVMFETIYGPMCIICLAKLEKSDPDFACGLGCGVEPH